MRPTAWKSVTAITTAMLLIFAGSAGAFANPNGNSGQGQSGNENGNPAQQDPSILFDDCETYGYTTSLLDMLLASNCLLTDDEGNGPQPSAGTLGHFTGNASLRVTSSEFSFDTDAGLTPPSRWVALEPEGAGSVEASGSAPVLEIALGALRLDGAPGFCGFITFEILVSEHTPGEGAPELRSVATQQIRVCAAASEADVVTLAYQMFDTGYLVPRKSDWTKVTAAPAGFDYRIVSKTPAICAGVETGIGIDLLAVGICEFNVLSDSVDIARYQFEIGNDVVKFMSADQREQLMPDSMTPAEEMQTEVIVPEGVLLGMLEGDEEIDGAPPLGALQHFAENYEVGQSGAPDEEQGSLRGEVRITKAANPETEPVMADWVEVRLGENLELMNGRLMLGSARNIDVAALNFMTNSKVSMFMYSTKLELGSLAADGELAELILDSDLADGDHTLRVVGISQAGVLWAISMPVNLSTASVSPPTFSGPIFSPDDPETPEPEATEDNPELSGPEVGTTPSPTPSTSGPLSPATPTDDNGDTDSDSVQVSALGSAQPIDVGAPAAESTLIDELEGTIGVAGSDQRAVSDFAWLVWVLALTMGGLIWLMAIRRRKKEEAE